MSERVTKHGLSPTHKEAMAATEPRHEIDPEKQKALETLCTFGLFKRVADIQLHHGRANPDGRPFVVSNSYDNRISQAGDQNINAVSALSTAEDRDIAQQYAERRVRDLYYRNRVESEAEVHRIVSNDPYAVVVNLNWSSEAVNEAQLAEINDALSKLALPASLEYAPVKLAWQRQPNGSVKYSRNDYTKEARRLLPQLPKDFSDVSDRGWISTELKMGDVANIFGIETPSFSDSEQSTSRIAKYILGDMARVSNSRKLVMQYPGMALNLIMSRKDQVKTDDDRVIPLSLQYIANWASQNHIIGLQAGVSGASIGRNFDATYLLDLNKTKTPEQLEAEQRHCARRLGRLAYSLAMEPGRSPAEAIGVPGGGLMDVLTDEMWVSPERIIAEASEVPLGIPGINKYWESFGDVFDADAGNWEGFTLGEHTETVLRNFENTYANQLPAKLLPIMRLSLLVHDIGKPVANYNNERAKQDEYNRQWAMVFLARAGINARIAELVVNMITDGKRLAERAYTDNARCGIDHPDINQLDNLRDFCFIQLQRYGLGNITDGDIDGLAELCLILQTCDSAAYTTMGVTHDSDNPGLYYRNYPSFEESFVSPVNMSREGARLKSAPDLRNH